MTEPFNAWKPEYVNAIMEGLAEYNPKCWNIEREGQPKEDRITLDYDNDQIEITRPEPPFDRWFYALTYYFGDVPPYGFTLEIAMYDDEEYVVDRIKRIIEGGGIQLTEEQLAQIAEWEERNFGKKEEEK